MAFAHIKEILEALRGKIIIDKITLGYDSSISEEVINGLPENLDARVNQNDTYIDLMFQPKFLTYVQWSYFTNVEQIKQVIGKAKTLDVCAHQLFEDKEKSFALRFSESGLIFENRKYIEDTLFLDLQRYCEHNKISYEVL
jgi:hypothetical protein